MARRIDVKVKLNSNVDEELKKDSKSVNKFTDSLRTMKGGLVAVTASAVALAGVSFARFSINAQKEAEKIETQFKTLLGTTELAKERFEELANFATTTPFQLNEIAEASKILQSLTGDVLSVGDGLRVVGDASAIAGVKINELAVTVGRAYSGLKANRPVGEALARLQELGLVSGETRNKIEDLSKEASGTEAWEVLQEELKKTNGGMESLSRTADGLESTLSDAFQDIGRTVAKETGIFEVYKESLSGLIQLGIDLKNAFDSTSVEKVRDEIEEVNEELERTSALIKSSKDLELDSKIFEDRRKVLIQQKKDLEEAILPATLKDRKKELKEAFDELSEVQSKYADNIIEDQKSIDLARKTGLDKFGVGFGVSNKLSQDFYRKESQRIKENISILEEEIKAIEENGVKKEEANKKATDSNIEETKSQIDKNFAIEGELRLQRALIEAGQEAEEIRKERARQRIEDRQKEEDEEARISAKAILRAEEFRKTQARVAIERKKQIKENNEFEQKLILQTASLAVGALKEIFGENKAFAVADIIINTARGIQRSFADLPPPFNAIQAGVIGVSGVAQLAKVNGAKFADGTEFVSGSGGSRTDSVPSLLSRGERVIDANDNARLNGVSNEELVNGNRENFAILGLVNAIFSQDEIAQRLTDFRGLSDLRGFVPQG